MSGWEKVALVLAAVFLVQYWLAVHMYLRAGDPFGHRNYWGADVGTFLLAAVCWFCSVAWAVVVWRHWLLRLFVKRKR